MSKTNYEVRELMRTREAGREPVYFYRVYVRGAALDGLSDHATRADADAAVRRYRAKDGRHHAATKTT